MRQTLTVSLRIPAALVAALLREYPPEPGAPSLARSLTHALETHAADLALPLQSPRHAWQTIQDYGVAPTQSARALGYAHPTTEPEPRAPTDWELAHIAPTPAELAAIGDAIET